MRHRQVNGGLTKYLHVVIKDTSLCQRILLLFIKYIDLGIQNSISSFKMGQFWPLFVHFEAIFTQYKLLTLAEFELRSLDQRVSTLTSLPPPRPRDYLQIVQHTLGTLVKPKIVKHLAKNHLHCIHLFRAVVKWSACLPSTPTIQD